MRFSGLKNSLRSGLVVAGIWLAGLGLATAEAQAVGLIDSAAPAALLATVNMKVNKDNFLLTPALILIDPDSDRMWHYPFSGLPNDSGAANATRGQPMHTAINQARTQVYVTMGGDDSLPQRLMVVDLGWVGGVPAPVVTASHFMTAPGTYNGTDTVQQGHGTQVTRDGRYLLFSEMQNGRLRVFDIAANRFAGAPVSHPQLIMPHGLWPNPSGTLAAAPQYAMDATGLSIWRFDGDSGDLAYDHTVLLETGDQAGGFLHTVAWLDDHRFYTNATQEKSQGHAGLSEQSVWLIDLESGDAQMAIGAAAPGAPETGLLKGVSDVVVTGNRLYACEGNIAQDRSPGHVSVWNIEDIRAPRFLSRLSAGAGLPEDFLECHGLFKTVAEDLVYAQSFRSHHLVKIEADSGRVARIWDRSHNLIMPHGLYIQ